MQHFSAFTAAKVRLTICVAFVAFLVLNAVAQQKTEPKDIDVIGCYGKDLATMFANFGRPDDLVAKRGQTEDDDRVLCDYTSFILGFRDQKVVDCFFLKKWTGPILGIKMGDSREDVQKVLGKPAGTFRDKDGAITAFDYPMKDRGITFIPNFDPATGKLRRVEIAELEKR